MPAVTPVQNEKLEAESVDPDGRLEADAQVIVVHFVELGARVQKTDVASDGKEEIVVKWRQLGELVLQHLRRGFGALAFLLDAVLDSLWKDLIWKLTKPVLEQRSNDIGVIQVVVRDEVNIAV